MSDLGGTLRRLHESKPDGDVVLVLASGRQIPGRILAVTETLVTVRPGPKEGRALDPASTVRISDVKEVRTPA